MNSNSQDHQALHHSPRRRRNGDPDVVSSTTTRYNASKNNNAGNKNASNNISNSSAPIPRRSAAGIRKKKNACRCIPSLSINAIVMLVVVVSVLTVMVVYMSLINALYFNGNSSVITNLNDNNNSDIVNTGVIQSTIPHEEDMAAIQQKQKQSVATTRPSCFDHGTPCDFDIVGKYLEASAKFTMIHKPSDAIPNHKRIMSHSMAKNATYIRNRREQGPTDGSLTPLVEYNPTLLPLNSDLDEKLLDYLTGRYHPGFTDEDADKAKYLYIARASNLHLCGYNMKRAGNPTKELSYLSLALLDAELNPIPGASAVISTFKALLPRCFPLARMNPLQDYQVIAARSTRGNKKKDQLFLTASDTKTVIFPFDIRRVPGPTNDADGWNAKIKSQPIPMTPQEGDLSDIFHGVGLQVRFNQIQPLDGGRACDNTLNLNIFDAMKNYHVFDIPDPNGGDDADTYMEVVPHMKRSTRKINFYSDSFEKYSDWELVPNGTMKNMKQGRRSKNDVLTNFSKEPPYQFPKPDSTVLESYRGRGTACCVDLEFGNQTFKVGISHLTTDSRGYISQFYAFDLRPPKFLNVAKSGFFCLGGMNPETDVNAEMQIFPFPDSANLHASNITYDCPHITFLSGMTEYQADKNYVVISYGVNDCYSRSIVVSKKRIIEFLDVNRTESWRQWNW